MLSELLQLIIDSSCMDFIETGVIAVGPEYGLGNLVYGGFNASESLWPSVYIGLNALAEHLVTESVSHGITESEFKHDDPEAE